MTPSIALILVSALAVTAVVVTWARTRRTSPRAGDETPRQVVQPAQPGPSVGQFTGDVAHDLNDLLTAITGHVELLIARLPPADPMAEDAQEVRRTALSAARLTRQLLAVSRSQPTTLEAIDVNAVTARTAGVLRGMLGEDIAVTLALGADIKRIRGSTSLVEEIVLNLALNARNAMPAGGRLTLTTAMYAPVERDGGPAHEYVRLSVADTGPGISEAAQANVFEPFMTAQDAGDNAAGLAKVDAIVREGGGHIRVESTVGVGTTFMVDLPVMSDVPTAQASASPVSSLKAGLSPILVVEDDPRVRELMRLVLARAGYDVVAVPGSREALAALNRRPDSHLLLIDVVMPEMNGYELATAARKIVPGARIVFMSGFTCDLSRQPPADGFLAKPFTVESLLQVVEQALDTSAA